MDTILDALSAQVRSHPPLPVDTVARLLTVAQAEPRGSAEATLIRHHLGLALDAVLARPGSGVDAGDLFQEASLAVVTAVEEYAARSGPPRGLAGYVSRVVGLHVDAAIETAREHKRTDQAFITDTRLLEAAEVELRRRLGRTATTVEIAALLEWTTERVELLGAMLADARSLHDETLLPFLDDNDEN